MFKISRKVYHFGALIHLVAVRTATLNSPQFYVLRTLHLYV